MRPRHVSALVVVALDVACTEDFDDVTAASAVAIALAVRMIERSCGTHHVDRPWSHRDCIVCSKSCQSLSAARAVWSPPKEWQYVV